MNLFTFLGFNTKKNILFWLLLVVKLLSSILFLTRNLSCQVSNSFFQNIPHLLKQILETYFVFIWIREKTIRIVSEVAHVAGVPSEVKVWVGDGLLVGVWKSKLLKKLFSRVLLQRHLDKGLQLCCQFDKHFTSSFCADIILPRKISNRNCKLSKTLSYQKACQ